MTSPNPEMDEPITVQRIIHNHEKRLEYEDAAKLLIGRRFYQVNRTAGLLARLPPNQDGEQALVSATKVSWSRHREILQPFVDKRDRERSCGIHYLVHLAPDHDKIYVYGKTMDTYRRLGGGVYPGAGRPFGECETYKTLCKICGAPAAWPGIKQCDACTTVTQRLYRFLSNPAGREVILRTLGKFHLFDLATILAERERVHEGARADQSASSPGGELGPGQEGREGD